MRPAPPWPPRPLFLLAALTAPVGVMVPKALVPLLFIAAAWQLTLRWRAGQWHRPFQGSGAVLAGAFAAWALLSALWALDATAAIITAAKLAGVLACLLVMLDGLADLTAKDRAPLRRTLILAFAVAAVFLAAETLSGAAAHRWLVWQGRPAEYDLTVLNRSGILLLLASWPAALALWRQNRRAGRLGAVLVLAATAAVITMGVSSSNQVAIALAGVAAAAAWFLGPRLPRLMALVVAVGILAAPVLPASILAPKRWAPNLAAEHYSGLHRLYIWQFTARRIAEAPVLGWGLDASRRIPGGDTKLPGGGNVMNMHPHNASLQIWLELGGVGALLTAAFLVALWRRAAVLRDRAARAAAAGLLFSGLVIANLSFGIWQTWWMAALALAGLILAMVLRLHPDPDDGPRQSLTKW